MSTLFIKKKKNFEKGKEKVEHMEKNRNKKLKTDEETKTKTRHKNEVQNNDLFLSFIIL